MKPQLLAVLLAFTSVARSADLTVAVAASFAPTFAKISTQFSQQTGLTISASSASSGQLFAQIQHGAGYDLFLSADVFRPQQLLREGIGIGPSRAYAYGVLALYSQPAINCDHWQEALQSSPPNTIAIANPVLAPFGAAAAQVLSQNGITTNGVLLASNAATPLNWLYSGSITHALTAYTFAPQLPASTSVCRLPQQMYSTIEQHLLRLNTRPQTLALANFLFSATVADLLRANGYTSGHDD